MPGGRPDIPARPGWVAEKSPFPTGTRALCSVSDQSPSILEEFPLRLCFAVAPNLEYTRIRMKSCSARQADFPLLRGGMLIQHVGCDSQECLNPIQSLSAGILIDLIRP